MLFRNQFKGSALRLVGSAGGLEVRYGSSSNILDALLSHRLKLNVITIINIIPRTATKVVPLF